MSRTYLRVSAVGVLAAAVTGIMFAQDRPATVRPADEAGIREASQAFARAFEKGDVNAFAALWTEEGEYLDENQEPVRGRAAVAKAYTDFFAKRQEIKAECKTDAIRFVGKDTAVEEGTFTVNAKDGPPNASRFSALYVRQDGKWLLALLKEWGDDVTDRADMDDLAWLIGTWESTGGDLTARTTYEWADNKKFIRAKYSVSSKKPGEPATSGTQVIGVDPSTGMVRAWTFDSDGGIGESSWVWDDKHWVIDSAGTLADGSDTTAHNMLAPSGKDAFTWRSVRRTLNGEHLPDLTPITVKRVAGQ